MIPQEITAEMLNRITAGTLVEHLGIKITKTGSDFIEAEMPVDHRTCQPYKLLHGGASVALAETLGSLASHIMVHDQGLMAVGLEINANHLRTVTSGPVTGRATIIHQGKSTHVWDIRIYDPSGKLSCISRFTVAIIPKR